MAHAGLAVGHAAAFPCERIIDHRKLVAKIFPRSVNEESSDSPAASVEHPAEMVHCAASQGMLFSALALLKDGRFSRDLPDRFGRTPLHWAAEQGHCDVVLALLRAGACVDPYSQCKATPIMLAASGGHVEVVRVLLRYRAGESDCWPLNRHRRGIDHWRNTALHCAAAGGHVRLVEALLDAGFDREQHDGAGLTPAEVSARKSHSTSPAITHLLLPKNDRGGKLVHDYVNMMVQDVGMVSGLVKGGAFLDWQDGAGDTPLHRAVHFHHATISRLLLRAGADPNLCDRRGTSPLHTAVCTECEEMVAGLLEAGACMELLALNGQTPLHMAVVKNNVNVVSLLLNAGASTEHRDAMHGETSLSWACRGSLASIARVLVEAGADVESRSSVGLTPLHWACRFIDAESVEALLNAGADPSAVDQAAADAVATSSSKDGTIVSWPTAIDVVGLGYPLDLMEDSRQPSVLVAARRLDLVSVRRIESALQDAKQERSWRRRGWLVVLANRLAPVESIGYRGERWVGCHGGCSPLVLPASMPSLRVSTLVDHPPYAPQKGASCYRVDANMNGNSSESHHSQGTISRGSWFGNTRLSRVDNAMTVLARGTFCRQRQSYGHMRAQKHVAAPLSEVVDALLELAVVEVGLFHKVVMFI